MSRPALTLPSRTLQAVAQGLRQLHGTPSSWADLLESVGGGVSGPDVRTRIVMAAMELFWAKGYNSTSIADILSRSQVNSGSLYHFFPGKQDVLLAVHNARHTYQPQQPLTAGVQAIARYKLADHLRSVSRRDARHDVLDDDAQLFAVSEVESAEASRDLTKLLKQLPERQRLPIVHVKLEGLSVEETAQLTGLSSSAVKVGIHRGLKALSRLIGGANNHED